MPELVGGRVQQLFDAYPWLFHLMIRSFPPYWRALARILHGDRGFADVDRILRRHPYIMQCALWLKGQQNDKVISGSAPLIPAARR